LYAPADFVVTETGSDETAPVILGRPFLNTSGGAVIYASAAKISFYIKGKKETFSFENKITQISKQSRHEPRKRTNWRNKNKQIWIESAKMITTVQGCQDRRLKSPFLTKKRMTQVSQASSAPLTDTTSRRRFATPGQAST